MNTNWLKIFDLKPRFFFAISLICTLALFLPQDFKTALGIAQIVDSYRSSIGAALLISAVLWLVQLRPWELLLTLIENRNFKKDFRNKVESLSDNEMVLLAYCLSRRKQTVYLSSTHAVATALISKGFMSYMNGSFFARTDAMPFNIPHHVWKELVRHKFDLFSKEDWNDPSMEELFKKIDQQMAETEWVTYR